MLRIGEMRGMEEGVTADKELIINDNGYFINKVLF